MSLRVTCAADAEIRTLAANGIDEVARVRERLRRRVTLRNIAAQRQNILNMVFLDTVQHGYNLLFGGGDTGQVRHSGNSVCILDF